MSDLTSDEFLEIFGESIEGRDYHEMDTDPLDLNDSSTLDDDDDLGRVNWPDEDIY